MTLSGLNPKQRLAVWAALALLAAALAWAMLGVVSPSPPRTVSMSTGAPDGAYHQFALKYQAILKDNGVKLVLLPSSGSVVNLSRLGDGSASAGFVQGGLGLLALSPQTEDTDSKLRALATVAYEPVWIFSKKLDLSKGLAALAGKRVAVGLPDSGNAKVALELLASFGVLDDKGAPLQGTQLLFEGGMAAAKRLQAGEADAIILVAAPQAAAVFYLLDDSSVELASLQQAEGLARRFPYFQTVSLKQGSVNLRRNIPAKDVAMIATTANLVIQEDLHPALAYLLLEAARQTHNRPSRFSRPGDFPSPLGTDFPLAEEAGHYFKNGRPFLQRYLPFWLANFVQRLILVLVPLLALVFPLVKFMPTILTWKQEKKLFRHYGELKFLEHDIASRTLKADEAGKARAQLDQIEHDVVATRFPLGFSDRVYTLRQHLDYVRAKLDTQAHASPGPAALDASLSGGLGGG